MDQSTIKTELIIKTSRSSGSGGQHVNKVSTKVEVQFHIASSQGLETEEKNRLLHKLANRISNAGYLIITSQATRSQLKNKRLAIDKLFKTLITGLYIAPIRKKKAISKAQKMKILKDKRFQSEKKAARKKIMKHHYQ